MLTGMSEAPATELPTDVLAVGTAKAAKLLGLSRRKFVDLIYSGEIKSKRVTSKRSGQPYMHLIQVAELQRWLDSDETPAP